MNQKPHSESEFLMPMTKGNPLWIWSTQLNSSATEIVNERHSPEIETSNHILTSPVQKRVNSPNINRTKGFGHFQQVLFKKHCWFCHHVSQMHILEKQSAFLYFFFAETFLGIQQTYAMVILCCSCDFRRLIQFVPICRGFAFRPVHTNGILSGGEFSASFPYSLFTSCLR